MLKQLFLHNLLYNNSLYVERGLLNIVYSNSEMLGKIFRKPQFFSLEISGPKVVENFRCNRAPPA